MDSGGRGEHMLRRCSWTTEGLKDLYFTAGSKLKGVGSKLGGYLNNTAVHDKMKVTGYRSIWRCCYEVYNQWNDHSSGW